ncbi:hypothetical protein DER46DRAFT_661807 [Fusarium sp. MPI-SDFR-AT-0072]|nr:hypothetical protein DER46DRAFT_661807 [Fusarium sp. MPI-SDFR-AT-0072]
MSDPPHLLDKRARIHNLVDEFFEQVQTADQQNRATLIKKTLSADALFQSPISLLPGDEMEERHDHAKAIQKRVRSVDKRFSLTALDVAVILNVPLSQLRPNGNLSALPRIFYCYGERLKIWEYSRVIVNFARYTNRQFKNDSAKISTQASSKKSASVSSKKGSNKRPYTEDEKDDDYKPDDLGCALATIKAVRERDGYACVFTRTSNPEVAHIIPASWNVTSVQIKKTTRLMVAIETLMAEKNKADGWLATNQSLLADPENPGSSDRPWNAVCMNRQLHFWFDNGLLGLKFLGSQSINDNPPCPRLMFSFTG